MKCPSSPTNVTHCSWFSSHMVLMLNEWFHILQNSLSLSDYEAYPKPKNQHNFRLQMLNNLTPKKNKRRKKVHNCKQTHRRDQRRRLASSSHPVGFSQTSWSLSPIKITTQAKSGKKNPIFILKEQRKDRSKMRKDWTFRVWTKVS